ncbi:hypothetical protein [Streptomyces sp. NPDC005989]|uniref:hypothetical protein n=1 Tax=Streptomyces sp. NPDC005989 TaxID=3156727 RepID=UPI00340A6146
MHGHDPLLIVLLLALVGLGIGCVQHRWPAIGEAIDIATKVLITLIGLLIFASNGTTKQNPPTSPVPAPSVSTAPADQGQIPGGGQ